MLEQELENAQQSKGAVALQVLSWTSLGGGFLLCSLLSILGDMTPWPFDGMIFGELGGIFLAALMLKGYRAIIG